MQRQLIFWTSVAVTIFILGAGTYLLPPYPQIVLARVGINIILAVGLNLVNGYTGQFSLGHAGFMAVGAYVAAAMTVLVFPPELLVSWYMPVVFLAALLVGGFASAFVGLLVGIPSLRLRGDYLAIVTLGFGEIIRISILNIEAVGGARGFVGISPLANPYWIWGAVVLTTIFIYRLVESVPGKEFMAVRDDETAATAMGLSTTRIKVRAFVISAFFAGIAGGLFAHQYAYLNPSTFSFNFSFEIVAMVVLGGMGSLSGSIVAAILLTVLLEVLRPLQEYTGVDLRMVIYSLVLIGLMLTRPQGIFGTREIWTLFGVNRFFQKRRAA